MAGWLAALVVVALACARAGPSVSPAVAIGAEGKPVPPVQVTLAFRAARLRRGEEVMLDLTLTATSALPRVRAVLRLPAEVRLIEGASAWEGPLNVDAPRRLTVRVQVEGGGRFTLGASAEILEGPYAGQIAGAALDLDATGDDIRWLRL
jgi:hypothetical protein